MSLVTSGWMAVTASVFVMSARAAAQLDVPCGEFERVATPDDGNPGAMLSGVAVKGTTGMAVGRFYPGAAGPFTPLLYRYDGATWSSLDLPSLPGGADTPVLMNVGMSFQTGSTAWVVGYVNVAPPTNNLPLVMRWRNGNLDLVETPMLRRMTEYPFSSRSGFAHDVAVVAEDDVWVVGPANGFGDARANIVAMALHWDGSGWEDVPTPIVANRWNRFEAVSASGSDNVWAAGFSWNIGGAFFGFICRWDGSSWQVVENPALAIPASQFTEILAVSPTEVWVAGAVNYTTPLLYRWNGSSWETMPAPGNPANAVISMDVAPTGEIYAVTAGADFSVYVWADGAWTEVPNPAPPPGLVDSGRSVSVAGPCDVWVVGSQMDSTGFLGTFAEHLAPSRAACPGDFDDNGTVNSVDVGAFINAWFEDQASGSLIADWDANGTVNSSDVSEFVNSWFADIAAGCGR